MERSTYHFLLLVAGELVKVYCVTRDTNGKCGVECGVIHRIDELLTVKDVYVEVVCILDKISVKHRYQIRLAFFSVLAKCNGSD